MTNPLENLPVEFWARKLKSRSPFTRLNAARALRDKGEKARVVLPELIQVLRDLNLGVRDAALAALRNFDCTATAVPVLTELLSGKNACSRAWTAKALAELGHEAQAAIPALLAASQDDDPVVRVRSAEALWRAGLRAEVVIHILTAAFRDDNEFYSRDPILRRFGQFGYCSMKPDDVREQRLASVRKIAAGILERIDPEAARKAMNP
jgi:HEAT repeat protein